MFPKLLAGNLCLSQCPVVGTYRPLLAVNLHKKISVIFVIANDAKDLVFYWLKKIYEHIFIHSP
jgi:hypothetical protein